MSALQSPNSETPASADNTPARGRQHWLARNAKVWVGALAGLCCLLAAVAVVAAGPKLAAGLPMLFGTATVPPCAEPTLTVGTTKFRIEPIARAAEGTLTVPADTPDAAYWVEGTEVQYVFALSPTPDNYALISSLQADEQATVTWSNCNSTTYRLAAPAPSPLNTSELFDQATTGITILVQASAATDGVLVAGDLVEEELLTINTPEADPASVQAEVSLLETSVAADGTTVHVEISILNTGSNAFTVSASDIALVPESAAAIAPSGVEPTLPLEIKPGTSEVVRLEFPRPAASTAILRVFDVEFDVDGW